MLKVRIFGPCVLIILGVSSMGTVQGWIFEKQSDNQGGQQSGSLFSQFTQGMEAFKQITTRFDEGWYFTPSCDIFCHLIGCLLKSMPSKEEMCQYPGNRNHACCNNSNSNDKPINVMDTIEKVVKGLQNAVIETTTTKDTTRSPGNQTTGIPEEFYEYVEEPLPQRPQMRMRPRQRPLNATGKRYRQFVDYN